MDQSPNVLHQTNLSYMVKPRYQLLVMVRHCERADDPSLPVEVKKHPGNDLIIEYDP